MTTTPATDEMITLGCLYLDRFGDEAWGDLCARFVNDDEGLVREMRAALAA